MNERNPATQTDEERRRGRSCAIERLIADYARCDNEDLLAQMMVTICRLAADNVDRGDLKLLNTALKELRYAFKVFAPYADTPKVTMFGSARTPEDHPQYIEAKRFAEIIQRKGWMVITGAGDGIMRAGHHGATREASFGVAISLPFEQSANQFIEDDEKLVTFKYFFTRKLVFVKEAHAIVLFPGGFGTQDEGFEAITLVQTGKTSPVPIVMCDEPGGTYWQHWQTYVKAELLGNAMIDPEDTGLFYVTDRAEDAVEHIVRFYRCYHSSRWVGDDFVMRLMHPLSPALLAEINRDFADILTSGKYEQHDGPIDGEDGAHPDKPRLVCRFNRRSVGRLRQLIDRVNEGG
ncbi:MAG: LOG family protein [Planctomycetes bacterium]|nr:LOG family protein [Planctomycetota bacterium]